MEWMFWVWLVGLPVTYGMSLAVLPDREWNQHLAVAFVWPFALLAVVGYALAMDEDAT